jgi:hypothetical protein
VTPFDRAVDDALATWWELHPVDASFAGETAYDALLPRADATAHLRERETLAAALAQLDAVAVPDDPYARLDARLLRATFELAAAELERRPRYHNPAWYTGDIAFGIIAHLLPGPIPRDPAALAARVDQSVDFLDDGGRRLAGRPLPAAWVERATAETHALDALLTDGLPLHPDAARLTALPVAPLHAALARFRAAIASAPDADPACGAEHLAQVIARVHGIDETPAALERRARAAFDATNARLIDDAARLDPTRDWRAQLAALADIGPATRADALASYAHWHERALRDAATLVTPADDYTLAFEPLPAWAQRCAGALYFLFYRSPAARYPGSGSTYWVGSLEGDADALRRAHNTAAVKMIHAVHHGSIGHHTQNARARAAASRVARIAGTDGATGIAMLGGGTMVEGWACYVEDLLAEIPGFYTPLEELQLTYFTLRNIACCIADIRLHTGAWTLEDMRAFYRDEVAFAPARIVPETTRNSMFPGSRVMYWTGTEAIERMRHASPLPAKTFHDTLLSFGSAPVRWIAEEEAVWQSHARF